MTYFNPIAGSFAQSHQVSRAQANERDGTQRRAEALRRSTATRQDELDHAVETSDAVILHEQEGEQSEQKRKSKKRSRHGQDETAGDDDGSLDLKA